MLTIACCCLQPLQIKSAVAVEGLKGYIYIEAYKQTHVKQVNNNDYDDGDFFCYFLFFFYFYFSTLNNTRKEKYKG